MSQNGTGDVANERFLSADYGNVIFFGIELAVPEKKAREVLLPKAMSLYERLSKEA
jgi:hypothetical protein